MLRNLKLRDGSGAGLAGGAAKSLENAVRIIHIVPIRMETANYRVKHSGPN